MIDNDETDGLWMLVIFLISCLLLMILLSTGCASASATLPVQEAVTYMTATAEPLPAEPQYVAKVRLVEFYPNEPQTKRLAVYNPEFWSYPYKDWQCAEIPEGEGWSGWYEASWTGYAVVATEISNIFKGDSLEASTDMKSWFRPFRSTQTIEYRPEDDVWYRTWHVPLIVDGEGKNHIQFWRLQFPWADQAELDKALQ